MALDEENGIFGDLNPIKLHGDSTEKQALFNFMINTVNMLFADHKHFPLDKMRQIEAQKGISSDSFNDFRPDWICAYMMLRDIEIIYDKKLF